MNGDLDLYVRQDDDGNWSVLDKKERIAGPYPRRQDARARARALLLDRGKGSVLIETPSGRVQEKLNVHKTSRGREVQAA